MQFGRSYEEFEVGAVYKHWPGKTVTEYDDHLFCLITMNHHPLHLDANYAATTQQGRNVVVGPVAGRLEREGPGGATYAITDYVCRVTGGSAAAGDDAADLRWVTRDELAALPTTERLAQLLSDWGVF